MERTLEKYIRGRTGGSLHRPRNLYSYCIVVFLYFIRSARQQSSNSEQLSSNGCTNSCRRNVGSFSCQIFLTAKSMFYS